MADTTVSSSIEQKFDALEKRFLDLEARYSNLLSKKTETLGSSLTAVPKVVASKLEHVPSSKATDQSDQRYPNEQPNGVPSAGITGKSRVRVIIARHKQDGEREEEDASDEAQKKTLQEEQLGYASILCKNIYYGGSSTGSVEIIDAKLGAFLHKMLQKNPWHSFLGDKVQLYTPYEDLVTNWDQLSSAI